MLTISSVFPLGGEMVQIGSSLSGLEVKWHVGQVWLASAWPRWADGTGALSKFGCFLGVRKKVENGCG